MVWNGHNISTYLIAVVRLFSKNITQHWACCISINDNCMLLLGFQHHTQIPQLQLFPSQRANIQLNFIIQNLRRRLRGKDPGEGVDRVRLDQWASVAGSLRLVCEGEGGFHLGAAPPRMFPESGLQMTLPDHNETPWEQAHSVDSPPPLGSLVDPGPLRLGTLGLDGDVDPVLQPADVILLRHMDDVFSHKLRGQTYDSLRLGLKARLSAPPLPKKIPEDSWLRPVAPGYCQPLRHS